MPADPALPRSLLDDDVATTAAGIDLRGLSRRFPGAGRLQAILLRPGRGRPALRVDRTEAHA